MKHLSFEEIAQEDGVAVIVIFVAMLAAYAWRTSADASAKWSSAVWGVGSGAILGLLAIYVSTVADKSYGIALFVGVPFLVGFVAVLARGLDEPVTGTQAMGVSTGAVTFAGLPANPFRHGRRRMSDHGATHRDPLAMCGGGVAYLMQRKHRAQSPAAFLLLIGLTPFGATLERAFQPPAELFSVTTSIDIPVAPARVWRSVLQPAKLAAPSHALFRAGIAYPLASHIEGTGLAATRYCDFSTGKLVEPVLIWKEGSQLRFTVVSNPLPMQEWTPYAQIHPPHLEGFLASRQGEFRLQPLANGGTRLLATTWYQHHMWPATYWRAWSDYTIHRVHDMVLKNISEGAEAYK